jgi:sulfate transport system permease protein
MIARLTLRTLALCYLAVLLLVPVGMILFRTFENGVGPVWDSVTAADAVHAFWLTLAIAAITVPLNAAFGVMTAIALVRHDFPGKTALNAAIDLPFALSPVVIGLALVLVYGRTGWLGPFFDDAGIQIIFALPGMVLATIFVCVPFVVREVAPVLREIGTEQEEAGSTLGAGPFQVFWRVTLPAIRWALVYGVVLTTARAIGEFGAVSVVSGRIRGDTETLTLLVENRYESFDVSGAYAAALVLALIALATLFLMTLVKPRRTL